LPMLKCGRLCVGSGRVVTTDPARTPTPIDSRTPNGRRALDRLTVAQHAWADAVGNAVGEDELRHALAVVRQIIDSSRAYREEFDDV